MPGHHGSSRSAERPPSSGAADDRRHSPPGNRIRRRQTLGRSQRLIRSADFSAIYAQERRWVGRYMVLWLGTHPDAALRLGVVAGRKVGGAVQRARAKRRLREVFRLNRGLCSGAYDVILVARRAILHAAWPDVVREFMDLTRRAGLTGKNGMA